MNYHSRISGCKSPANLVGVVKASIYNGAYYSGAPRPALVHGTGFLAALTSGATGCVLARKDGGPVIVKAVRSVVSHRVLDPTRAERIETLGAYYDCDGRRAALVFPSAIAAINDTSRRPERRAPSRRRHPRLRRRISGPRPRAVPSSGGAARALPPRPVRTPCPLRPQ
jgi:hypothetical protein